MIQEGSKRLPIDIQDEINSAAHAEEQRNLDEIVTSAGKIAFALDILPTTFVAKVIQMDMPAIYDVILSGDEVPEKNQDPVNQLYAFLRIVERESYGDLREMTNKLHEEQHALRENPEESESTKGRSPIQAMIEGDIEQVLFVAQRSSEHAHEDD